MAIVDEVTVIHTRPVGGPNYKYLRQNGISPWDELRALCHELGADERPLIETYGVVYQDNRRAGRATRDRVFDLRLGLGWISALKDTPNQKMVARRIAGYAYKSIFQLPDRVVEGA
jgi:hypothetical protein